MIDININNLDSLYLKSKFEPNHWGRLPVLQVPYAVFRDGKLCLSPVELGVYLTLLEENKVSTVEDRECATVGTSLAHIGGRTGYSRPTIIKALDGLKNKGFIDISSQPFSGNEYTLMDPETGALLEHRHSTNVMHANGVRYFTLPRVVARNALADLCGSGGIPLCMYAAVCHEANNHWGRMRKIPQNDRTEMNVSIQHLAMLSGLPQPKVPKAIQKLSKLRLIEYTESTGTLILLDPRDGTQRLMQKSEDEKNNGVGALENVSGDYLRNLLTERGLKFTGRMRHKGDKGRELYAFCPAHADAKPSFTVNIDRKVFKCHSPNCDLHRGGRAEKLLYYLSALNGGMPGSVPAPDKNDSKAEAVYSYFDERGKLIRQKLRLPGKEFKQRRPSAIGKWHYSTSGMAPMLYNAHRLKDARIVILTEGEKDADNLNQSGDLQPGMVACTSGDAGSWDDALAEKLIGKRVIIMPHDDASGEAYCDAIKGSLQLRGIEYAVMRFKGPDVNDITDWMQADVIDHEVVVEATNEEGG